VDPDSWVLVQLGLVTLVAATLQGGAGFGFGLLALPAYMVILDSIDAVPLVIILGAVFAHFSYGFWGARRWAFH
jgi:uncharacterized membrane protein YfcA